MISLFLLLGCTTNYESTTNVVLQSCCDALAGDSGADDGDSAGDSAGNETGAGDSASGETWTPPALDPGPAIDPDCHASPAPVTLDPAELWSWPPSASEEPFAQVSVTPVVAPLFDTDGDGAVTGEDTPQVVFTAYYATDVSSAGALYVLDGLTGDQRLRITSFEDGLGVSEVIRGRGGIALGDLDGAGGDGRPEVCVTGYESALVCFTATVDADGAPTLAYRWSADWPTTTDEAATLEYGYPSLADFDGDGAAEVALGNHVWSRDGVLLYAPDSGCWGGPEGNYGVSVPYDIDGDAALELAVGHGAFDVDAAVGGGSERWCDHLQGYPAVADLDGNGAADVVSMSYARLYVNDAASGATTPGWPSVTLVNGYASAGNASPPVIADLDGDGRPNVALTAALSAGVPALDIYGHDGALTTVWSPDVVPASIAGFDFEGDGVTELVVSGGHRLFVLGLVDGVWVDRLATATTGWDPQLHEGYGQKSANVAIANVDGVGGAELVVPNAIPAALDPAEPAVRGIVVLHSASEAWKPARPVWNQHAYSITNVNDDATVPATPLRNIDLYNNFRVADNAGIPSFYQPALGIGAPVYDPADCDEGVVTLYVAVQNGGANVATNVEVRAVNDAGAYVSAVVPSLAPGANTYVTLEIDALAWGNALTVVLDPDDTVDECGDVTGSASASVALGAWPCAGR